MKDTLDAALFLLLTSAAVTTLAVPVDQPTAGSADPVATVVATSTARVNYTLLARPGWRPPVGRERSATGTLAQLLAAAATRDVAVDGREITRADDGFERAVRVATANATAGGDPVAVDAVWEPYPEAPVRGHVHVGPHPPPTADVWAVTIPVGGRMGGDRHRVRRAARTDGYAGVARVLARRVVGTLFPPRRMAVALRGDGDAAAFARHRYRRVAGLIGIDIDTAVANGTSRTANRRLRLALARRFEEDLRTAYETPVTATRAVSGPPVRVTVRRWSP